MYRKGGSRRRVYTAREAAEAEEKEQRRISVQLSPKRCKTSL